jgi:phage terminase large subunit GpA-like protein
MDATSDPAIEGVVIVKPTRSAGTEIINNAIGRSIDIEPRDILYVQSTDEISQKYSTEILMKRVILPTPALREKIINRLRGRKVTDKITQKNFPGGSIHMVGAKSEHKFTMVDYGMVIFDDVAKYEDIKSGNIIELGIGRTKGIQSKKIVLVSNPGTDGECILQPYYENTDQRHRYVPCPLCGEFQVLKFGGKDEKFGIKWDAEDVWYMCIHCQGKIPEHEKINMDVKGEWRAHAESKTAGWVGYNINPFLNPFQPWRTEFVDRWLASKSDPAKRKTFITERLGEWWKPYKKELSVDNLFNRREEYEADVPRGTLVITIGADVQPDRIECEAIGYGRDYESWSIEKKVIYGNPAEDSIDDGIWKDVDDFFMKTWKHESGIELGASRCFIDSGDGNITQKVYDFCTPREVRGVYACKGENRYGQAVFSKWSMVNNKQTKLAFVGTDTAKGMIYPWLALKEEGAGFVHVSTAVEDKDYFLQLTSEYYDKGKWHIKAGRRNEGIDIRVYSLSALFSLKPDWDELEQNMGADSYAYRACPSYNPSKHLLKSLDYKITEKPIIVCVDFNTDPCVWMLAQADGSQVKVFDEIVMRGADVVRMGKELRKRYANLFKANKQFIVYGKPENKSDYALLGELGLRRQVINKKADIKAGVNAINNMLEGIQGEVRLTLHPKCVMLKKDLERGQWTEDGTSIDKASGRGNALIALSYYIGDAFPLRQARANPNRKFYK